jgi:triphosphoribosyl-dephospho-CoA synthetase
MSDILFTGVKWSCTVCGQPMGACDCWIKCECGISNQKGDECRNQVWHVSKRFAEELAEEVVSDMADGYRAFQSGSVSGNQNIIGRLKRTIARRAHPFFMSCFEGVEASEVDRRQKGIKKP